MVTVKFFTLLSLATGEEGYESGARDVGALLDEVEGKYGDAVSRYLKGCVVLVNGKNAAYLSGRATKLSKGDVVALFPPVAGG